MDAIDTFLEAMFAPYPATPRMTEAKAELRAMMEDAYADAVTSGKTHNEAVGQVITDFGNLEELAPVLGILPEIRDAQAEQPPAPPSNAPASPSYDAGAWPVVTLPEAQQLAKAKRQTGPLLAAGVSLCVLAAIPVTLISVLGPMGLGWFSSDSKAFALMVPMTLMIVAFAVMLLLRRRQAFAGIEHLAEGRFVQDPIVSSWASRLRVEHEGTRSRALMIAVGLWIISAIPVMTFAALKEPNSTQDFTGLGVAGTLLLVATGLYIFLPANWAASTHELLSKQGRSRVDVPDSEADRDRIVGVIAAIYWPVPVVAYLIWSFGWDAWERSWLIWPIAGILFGAIAAGIGAWSSGRRAN
ncbi:Uncharacterised protein [Actinomyces bovis]|uniref:Uncharacterized protein n=1 Tax=Actinomyces bovis TaxID=1658 RepID=A0ABY1VN80_9ACTO|nr:permease prefix domain 1-containing protein [Actinomyces bovis]SPT53515.1 Uncharacterised protein [Actinomyces bovis]VEG55440.1 Uncharacterised protein [Actinomyces israelii]